MSALYDFSDLETPTPARKPGGRPAKDRKSRQRKILCGSCGFIAYTTAGALETAGGVPACACGGTMDIPNMRDRLAIAFTYDDAVGELLRLPRAVRREILTAAGWTRDQVSGFNDHYDPKPTESTGRQGARCQWEHGYCQVFTAGRFCREHEQAERGDTGYRYAA